MSLVAQKKEYRINLDGHAYSLYLGRDILSSYIFETLQKNTNKEVLIIFDIIFSDKVNSLLRVKLEQAGYNIYMYAMEAGKHNKTIYEAIKIYELLESNYMSRDSTIIAFGGGVIGDLAGFVASTYFRGINLIHVPTTLTAMIDSSIGGKVAINFRKTVNAIGNYYHPILNVVDLDFIETLSMRDFKAGLAEIIKCAVIADKEFFDYLFINKNLILEKDEVALLYIMSRAIEIKLDHVKSDVKERRKRLKLNYGHTLGHAIEVSTGIIEEVYRHGEGVSLGMVGAAFIANEYFGNAKNSLLKHEDILSHYNLPIRINLNSVDFDREELIKECTTNIYKDKKKKGNKLRFVLSNDIGDSGIYNDISNELIIKAFKYLTEEN